MAIGFFSILFRSGWAVLIGGFGGSEPVRARLLSGSRFRRVITRNGIVQAGRLGGAFGGFVSGDGAFQPLALWAVTGGFFSLRFRSGWAVLVGGSGESEPRGPKSWATLILRRRGALRGISHCCTMFVVGVKLVLSCLIRIFQRFA